MLACARCGVRSQTVGETRCTVCQAPLCAYCSVLGIRTCALHAGTREELREGLPGPVQAPQPVREAMRGGEARLSAVPVPDDAVRVALDDPQTVDAQLAAEPDCEVLPSPSALEDSARMAQERDILSRWPWRPVLDSESCLTRFEAAARGCDDITYDLQGRRAALRSDLRTWEKSTAEVEVEGTGRILTLGIRREMRARGSNGHFPVPFVVEMRACVGERDGMGPEQVALLRELLAPLYTAQTGFHYLALFSPCGWGEEAREMVQKKIGSGIMLKAAKPVLVGPEGAYMNRGDVRAQELDALLPPRTEAERQAALVQGIEVLLQGRKGLELREVVDVYGCQADEALKAFKSLQGNGTGRMIRTGWGGVMLVRRDSA